LITPHNDERGKKYIELAELLFAVGPLAKNISDNQTRKQQNQTIDTTPSDNTNNQLDTQVLKARIEGLEAALKAKEEIVRIKDEQLRQNEIREVFYQDELRAVRLLAAPRQIPEDQTTPKRKKWL
jgi:hypothetical protein